MKLLIAAMILFCGSAMADIGGDTHGIVNIGNGGHVLSDGCNITSCDDNGSCISTLAYCGNRTYTKKILVDLTALDLTTVENFSYGMKPVPLLILPDGRCVVNGTIAIKDQCEIQMMIEMDKLRSRQKDFESKVSRALHKSCEQKDGE